jgi:hypothetical protein
MECQVPAGPVHTTPEVGKTGKPLVIKGVERIEAIILQDEDCRRDAELYSHFFSRVMRRDFNLTSVKLFWYTKGFHRRAKAKSLLQDLMAEAQRLEDMARPFEWPEESQPAATCTMRIVCDSADLLFDALITADRALHKLMHSEYAEVAEENATPFMRAFTALRKDVFGFFNDGRGRPVGPSSAID